MTTDEIDYANVSTKQIIAKADEVTAEAAVWVNSIDRSRLGIFAVPDERFIKYIAELSFFANVVCVNDLPHLEDMFNKEVDAVLRGRLWAEGDHEAYCEYILWNDERRDESARRYAIYTGSDNPDAPLSQNGYAALLYTVYRFPDYLAFFENGVWDMSLIKQCIHENIDPVMAKSLVKI